MAVLLLIAIALIGLVVADPNCANTQGGFCNSDPNTVQYMPSSRWFVVCGFPVQTCDTSKDCCHGGLAGPEVCAGTCVVPPWGWAIVGIFCAAFIASIFWCTWYACSPEREVVVEQQKPVTIYVVAGDGTTTVATSTGQTLLSN